MRYPLEAANLSKRYGRTWALRDCSLQLPAGRVAALVGPNGAGKTTLLHLAMGLLRSTAGTIRVFGYVPQGQRVEALSRVGFLAQDHPLYHGFTVADTLALGRRLNPRWDGRVAAARLERLNIPLDRKVGKLSGGQQAQVALAVALAKRPDLLLLDEPVASLDPLARREFLGALMEAVAEDSLTVLLSSHILADLERVCDYLIVLAAGRVQLSGDIGEIVGEHKLLVGPQGDTASLAHVHEVVEERHAGRQTTALVRTKGPLLDPAWDVREATLEEIALAYLGKSATPAPDSTQAATAGGAEEVAR